MPATYREELCPKCGSDVYDNTENKRNPKAPDYKCSDKDCDYVVWPPRGGSRRSAPPRQFVADYPSGKNRREIAPAPQRNGNDDRSNRIERQHSQEMALRLAAIDNRIIMSVESGGNVDMKKLKWFIDWFQKDVAKLPEQSEPPQSDSNRIDARKREPEPEPDIQNQGQELSTEEDEIPF